MAQHSRTLITPPTPPVIEATHLTRRFGERTVLRDISLRMHPGEFVALLGRSGSGKSTLLKAIAGLDRSAQGSGALAVSENVAVAFQDSRLLPWLRLLDNILLGLTGPATRERALKALYEVGLAGRENAWPGELSGGEQQRAALARCLVRRPSLLLADEPFGALDALTRLNMQQLLRQLCQQHHPAVLLVTHDVDEAIVLAQRILVLQDGAISLEMTIDPLRNRIPSEHQRYRQRLLAELGVAGSEQA
ncbi:ABC transporter ATP-binding protein [Pantoea sp. App145]|uniref:ABC transporter ATP-binding protein n=1 Tax=Pantoea sp. App145 TaxID=3071567 RepID=UPI003A7F99C9